MAQDSSVATTQVDKEANLSPSKPDDQTKKKILARFAVYKDTPAFPLLMPKKRGIGYMLLHLFS